MKKTINFYDFRDAFHKFGRGDQFSASALRTLFDYLEDYEEGCDIEIELDVIALCCDYTEYENLEEFHKIYDKEDYPSLERLRDHTEVIEVDEDSFIIGEF